MCCALYRKRIHPILLVNIATGILCYLSLSHCEDLGFDEAGNWTILPDEETPAQFSYLRQIPFQSKPPKDKLYSFDQIDKLRGKYKLQDFLWTGSGDGPLPSEPQNGGLAWEENGAYGINGASTSIVLITKTMVLFKTVLTTVYPVEVTPTVIQPTPTLSVIPTPIDSSSLDLPTVTRTEEISVEPTPTIEINPTTTLTIVEIFSSISPTPNDEKTTYSPEPMPTPAPGLQTEDPSYTNRLYWVNTIIKANGSQVQGEFQNEMQKNLAQVYASAFKRHLLSSLGVLKLNGTSLSETSAFHRRRRRNSRWKDSTRDELDFQWLLLRETGMSINQIKSLAATVMNVSVSIVNITSDNQKPHVSLDYVVTAEGNPVPASTAVHDLHLITKREMEKQIGYEIIKKAEPLILLPRQEEPSSEGASTSPWLIVAITTICLLFILIIVLIYMVWKWKHNRLGDTAIRARPQSGIEEGVINPAFLGPPSPIERSDLQRHRQRERPSSSIIIKSERDKERFQREEKHPSRRSQEERQISLASDLSKQLERQKEKSSPSSAESDVSKPQRKIRDREVKEHSESPSKISEEEFQKEQRRRRKKVAKIYESPEEKIKSSPKLSKTAAEKRSRRKTRVIELKKSQAEESKSLQPDDGEQQHRPSSASRDKIRYDNLDLSQDPLARNMSDEARRLIQQSRARSTTPGDLSIGGLKNTEIEQKPKPAHRRRVSGVTSAEQLTSDEQDRELSESLEQIPEAQKKPTTKDAQVQTPTRIRGVKTKAKPVPKSKASRSSSKLSTESLLSTESEETIEIKESESLSEANPLGKMRKRFHQFLDDAFNVMGKRENEHEEGRAKSARVSVTHEIETTGGEVQSGQSSRPWSQLIREESLEQIRPKSSTPSSIVPPKRAWTAGTQQQQRRCQSASSGQILQEPKVENVQESEICDLTSTTIEPSTSTGGHQSILTFSGPIFPGYPIYPDLPLPNTQSRPSKSKADSATPLIEAIKTEIKRFDKEKERQSSPK